MEVKEIKALLVLMQEYGLAELEIDDKKRGRVRLVRAVVAADAMNGGHPAGTAAIPAGISASTAVRKAATPGAAPAAGRASAIAHDGAPAASAPALAENQTLVTSPMVGTFYRSSSPDSPPLVEEGDSVRKGQTLCIIEAMKMMNEIESQASGRVVKILCGNAQPIEYGQPIMIIEIG
jgi:acetyl-CoA carboxylase biotin carboxyl carrier protein